MEFELRQLIRQQRVTQDEQSKELFMRTVNKILNEPPTAPLAPEKEERKKSQRKSYQKRVEARKRERPTGFSVLAQKERELSMHSSMTKELTQVEANLPDPDLAAYQVSRLVNPSAAGHQKINIIRDNVRLFRSLRSGDSVESMSDRFMVALHSVGMSCAERASITTSNFRALDVNIRGLIKCAKVFQELGKWKDERMRERKRKQDITVLSGPDSVVSGPDSNEPPGSILSKQRSNTSDQTDGRSEGFPINFRVQEELAEKHGAHAC